MRIRKDFSTTCQYPAGWPGSKDQENKTDVFFIKARPFVCDQQMQKTNKTRRLEIELHKNK